MKNKADIVRQDLKYNFLRNVIIRFDYSGLEDQELENVISDIGTYLKNQAGYVSKNKILAKTMEFDIEDPEAINDEALFAKNINEVLVYVFEHENPAIKLKLSNTFAIISIAKTKYVSCVDYCKSLISIMRLIKEKVPYFQCRRFGLRKQNICYLYQLNSLNNYFEIKHFSVNTYGKNSRYKLMNHTDNMIVDDYNLNLKKTITYGTIDTKDAYQIGIDADIYLIDDELLNAVIDEDGHYEKMNDLLFDVYKDTITESFINSLIDGQIGDEIEGVEAND